MSGAASSRTTRSAFNAAVSVLSQVLIIVLGFVTRSVFIAQLGIAYVGINSLLTSVLAMLTLADLGINGAVMYALYGPLKNGDTERVAAIVHYARTLFRWVALVIAIVGLAGTPFIHLLVQLDANMPGLEAYYLVSLCSTVAGYLMLNRLLLLNADQKIYITKTYSMVFNSLRSFAQIASLLMFESFFAYLMIQVVSSVANNLVVYLRAGQIYPYLKKHATPLDVIERKSIRESVQALMIFRVGRLVMLNSVPLLISIIMGTRTLGYYSNYMLIVSAAVMITDTVFTALTPSVGNLIARGDRQAGRRLFDEVVLLSMVIHGAIAVAVGVLVDDFVVLWLGPEYILPSAAVAAIAFNFYVTGTLLPLWSFRNATGLFRKTQWMMLGTAALSVMLAFTLGRSLGLLGVVIAPAIAWILTGAWYEPLLLFREHLSGGFLRYFLLQMRSLVTWVIVGFATVLFGSLLPWGTMGSMLAKVAFLAILLPVSVWIVFGRTAEFHGIVGRVHGLIVAARSKVRR